MDIILRGEPKEITALVVGLQERQLPEISEKVAEIFADKLTRQTSSVHIPE